MARLKNNLYKPMNVDELKDPVVFVFFFVKGVFYMGGFGVTENICN